MGHAHKVVVILVLSVASRVDRGFFFGAHVRDELFDVLYALVGKPDDAAGEIGIASAEVVGGLLQHENAGALLPGSYGGAEGGIARADYHYVIIACQGVTSMCGYYGQCR